MYFLTISHCTKGENEAMRVRRHVLLRGEEGHLTTVNKLYAVNIGFDLCTIWRRQPTRLGLTSLEREAVTGSVKKNDTDDTGNL